MRFLLLLLFLLPSVLLAEVDTLVPFNLEDPSGARHTDAEYRGRVVVLIGSDRGGSEYNPVWGKALRDSLRTHPAFGMLRFLPVADGRSVPRLVRNMMKKMLPKGRVVLLDWEGVLPSAYSFVPGKSNIIIFGSDGRVVYRTRVTVIDPPVLRAVTGAVRKALVTSGLSAD